MPRFGRSFPIPRRPLYLPHMLLSTGGISYIKLSSEKIGIYEIKFRFLSLRRIENEIEGIIETFKRLGLLSRSIAEKVDIVESVSKLLTTIGAALKKIILEIEGIYETRNRFSSLIRKISEKIGIYETVRRLGLLIHQISEIEKITETIANSIISLVVTHAQSVVMIGLSGGIF